MGTPPTPPPRSVGLYWLCLTEEVGTSDVQGQVNLKNRIADICHVKELKVEKVSHTDREVKNTELGARHIMCILSSLLTKGEKKREKSCFALTCKEYVLRSVAGTNPGAIDTHSHQLSVLAACHRWQKLRHFLPDGAGWW